MNILLTGGSGYIGTHTAVELMKLKHKVIIVDNYSNSNPKAINRVEQITGETLISYCSDVADYKSLDYIFASHNIDVVIHFAGYKAVGESVKNPLSYYRNNIDSTLTLLEVMQKHDVKNFIFSSSAAVYGISKIIPVTEENEIGSCSNPYGRTKLMIEQILNDVSSADSKMSIILFRYFNPVGAHESGLIGEMPNGVPNNLLPYITQVAVGKLKELCVYGNDYHTADGTGIRDYIHIVDLAKGHVSGIEYIYNHKGVEIFNLGTGVGYSVLEIINTFEKVNNIKIPYKIVDRRSGDIAECFADVSKANKKLGWKAEKSLEDMCRDSWNWQIKNPNGY